MRRSRVGRRPLWRFRRNPLRRREDVLEAWVLLVAWLAVVVAGPFVAVLSAEMTAHTAAQRRAERQPATATLLTDVPHGDLGSGSAGGRVSAPVSWTDADGTRHTGKTLVDGGQPAGARVEVWTDRQDRLTTAPPSATQAGVDAAFMGAASYVAVVAGAAAGYYGVRLVLDRRRLRAWDAEWQNLGPRWGRTAG